MLHPTTLEAVAQPSLPQHRLSAWCAPGELSRFRKDRVACTAVAARGAGREFNSDPPLSPQRSPNTLMNTFELTHALDVLERTPATFRSLLDGLPEAWTEPNEGPGTFSAFDSVGHLIHGERTDWIPRARIILAQGPDRRFEPYDRFAQYRESEGKSMADLLDDFARLRAANVATLSGWQLTERQLALEGEHPALGQVTLRQLLAAWVAHDLGHLAQTARVMAKQYRDAVGPWREYLPVLDR